MLRPPLTQIESLTGSMSSMAFEELVELLAWIVLTLAVLRLDYEALRTLSERPSRRRLKEYERLQRALTPAAPPPQAPRLYKRYRPPLKLAFRPAGDAGDRAVATEHQAVGGASDAAASATADLPAIGISLLGPFRIEGAEHTAPRSATEQLIAYLALRPRGASRDQPIEAIWPDERPPQSSQRFWQNVSDARNLLAGALRSKRGHYTLDRHDITVDADLRRDWQQTSEALATRNPLLRAVSDTDFLQTVTLLTTYDARRRWDERAASNGEVEGSDGRPPVSCKRRDVLRLTLEDYQQWREAAVRGYEAAGRLLMSQFFFAPKDLPYRTQLAPLAAILAVLGQDAEAEAVKAQLRRWYWCGVFGEFYGSATETRFARDLPEVVAWVRGGAEPDTVAQASFAPGRLHTLRSRQSAAYKGLYALLMRDGARDFRTGDTIHLATYFDDQVDIHHVFPQGWFKDEDIENPVMDSVVNKTPLSKLTNIQIGKKAPSVYLAAIEAKHHLSREELDAILRTHVIDPEIIRTDDFEAFYAARFEELLQRIETAMGKPIPREPEEASASAGQESVDYEGAAAADGQLSTVGAADEFASVS